MAVGVNGGVCVGGVGIEALAEDENGLGGGVSGVRAKPDNLEVSASVLRPNSASCSPQLSALLASGLCPEE